MILSSCQKRRTFNIKKKNDVRLLETKIIILLAIYIRAFPCEPACLGNRFAQVIRRRRRRRRVWVIEHNEKKHNKMIYKKKKKSSLTTIVIDFNRRVFSTDGHVGRGRLLFFYYPKMCTRQIPVRRRVVVCRRVDTTFFADVYYLGPSRARIPRHPVRGLGRTCVCSRVCVHEKNR